MILALFFPPYALSASEHSPSLYLLAVGVNDYRAAKIPDLLYSDDDAFALVRWAEEQEGRLYQTVHAKALVSPEADRATILREIATFFAEARPEDQLILFLGGHGVVDDIADTYHFLPGDTDPSNILGSALEWDDVVKKITLGRADHRRTMIWLDTCQAGAASDALSDGTTRALRPSEDAAGLSPSDLSERAELWAILTAGTAKDRALEGEQFRLPHEGPEVQGHGLFTFALLEAIGTTMADRDDNGLVTYYELQAYVSDRVRSLSKGGQLSTSSGRQVDIPVAWAPGSIEACDGVDNDLDGLNDEGFPDENGNGTPDCVDIEICNAMDDNGNGIVDEGFDLDGDGFTSIALCGTRVGTDCDDNNRAVHPDQEDWPNLRDDDCDTLYDEDDVDYNLNHIPDSLEQKDRRYTLAKRSSFGAGLALGVASAVVYSQLFDLYPESGNYQAEVNGADRYAQFSRLTLGLMVPAVISLGATGRFSIRQREFRLTYLPTPAQTEHKSSPQSQDLTLP